MDSLLEDAVLVVYVDNNADQKFANLVDLFVVRLVRFAVQSLEASASIVGSMNTRWY